MDHHHVQRHHRSTRSHFQSGSIAAQPYNVHILSPAQMTRFFTHGPTASEVSSYPLKGEFRRCEGTTFPRRAASKSR